MEDEEIKPNELPGVDAGRANDESVVRAHAQLRRTPVVASPITFFTSIALIVVFIFAWFYIRRYYAEGDTNSYLADRSHRAAMQAYLESSGEDVEVVVDGAQLYAQQCVACHQANGQGLANAFPPLDGSEWVNGEPSLAIKVLLSGLSGPVTVKGNTYNGAMPGFGAIWDDAHIAAVVSYIRTSWSNEASEVTPEEVAEVRGETGQRGPWTAAELSEYF